MNVNEGTDSVISPITNASSPTPGNADHQAGVAAVTAVEEVLSSPTTEQLNMRCTGVKRLLKEALELREPNELFCARPLEDNLFEWHFTVRGPPDTVYADGVYHGRIVLPTEYPMKPPNLILLTPNGRFETNKKICLSISGYHPETWLPSWSIRTALLALIGFMPTHPAGALGGLECSQEERRRLALKSLKWHCPQCNICMQDALTPLGTSGSTEQLMAEVKSASTPPAPLVQNLAKKKMTESGGNGIVQHRQTDSSAPAGSTPQQNTTASSAFPTSSSIMDVPSPVPPPSTRPTTGQTRNGPTRARSAFLESPLLWIFVLFVLFLALLFRRLLLNYPHILQPHQGQDHRGL